MGNDNNVTNSANPGAWRQREGEGKCTSPTLGSLIESRL